MIVAYNFVIGVLIMLSSGRLAEIAGCFVRVRRTQIIAVTRLSTFTFGACVAVLSSAIYFFVHLLKFGV
jgi:hypothetical protein